MYNCKCAKNAPYVGKILNYNEKIIKMNIPRLMDMDKEGEGWKYETKCKRCGLLEVRNVHKTSRLNYDNFKFAICEAIKLHIQFDCVCCEKYTIQDIVSYELY